MKFVFLGTPDFAVKILEALRKAGLLPALIITGPDEPKGRGQKLKPPSVKDWALKYNIQYEQPISTKDLALIKEKIKKIEPEIFIVASFGKMIPKELLSIPKKGALNVHPSLLPKYRGPSPIQSAILNGDKQTGVTIFLLDEKMDHGPILVQKEISIEEKENYLSLYNKLAELGSKLLIAIIPLWLKGRIMPKEQDHQKATYTHLIKKEDGHINWYQPALNIEQTIRAFQPWPGAFSFFEDNGGKKRIYFLKAKVIEGNSEKQSGESFPYENAFAIQAKNSALLIERLKLEGKREMQAEDLLRGHHQLKNSCFF